MQFIYRNRVVCTLLSSVRWGGLFWVCCCVLLHVALCCSVLQSAAVCLAGVGLQIPQKWNSLANVSKWVGLWTMRSYRRWCCKYFCCSVLQSVAVYCSLFQRGEEGIYALMLKVLLNDSCHRYGCVVSHMWITHALLPVLLPCCHCSLSLSSPPPTASPLTSLSLRPSRPLFLSWSLPFSFHLPVTSLVLTLVLCCPPPHPPLSVHDPYTLYCSSVLHTHCRYKLWKL